MGNVKLQTFYPENGPIASTNINANNGALESSTAGYNEQNVSR